MLVPLENQLSSTLLAFDEGGVGHSTRRATQCGIA